MRPTDEIMQERREERLKRLCAFMLDTRLAPLNMGRAATHNLLSGWFYNSYWRTAFWCLKQAVRDSWQKTCVTAELLYWRYVLRLDREQVEARMMEES